MNDVADATRGGRLQEGVNHACRVKASAGNITMERQQALYVAGEDATALVRALRLEGFAALRALLKLRCYHVGRARKARKYFL